MSAHIVPMLNLEILVSWSVERGLLERMGMSSPEELGQLLHDENVRSVNYRYNEDTVPDRYEHHVHDFVEGSARSIDHLIGNLNYQCCETSDWNTTKANECLAHMECDLLQSGHRAVKSLHDARHPMVVAALLEQGHDPNGVLTYRYDSYQNRPLHWARSPEIAEALIAAGAEVNAVNQQGETPLHALALHSPGDILQVLIDHGADINARDKSGNTPLHTTTSFGTASAAEVLVNAGADPTIRNNEGLTPLEAAEKNGLITTKAILESAMLSVAANSWSPTDADADALLPEGYDQQAPVQSRARRL